MFEKRVFHKGGGDMIEFPEGTKSIHTMALCSMAVTVGIAIAALIIFFLGN